MGTIREISTRRSSLWLLGAFAISGCAGQRADPSFSAPHRQPSYGENPPVVCVDEAHNNSHTAVGLYRPFTILLESDGLRVRPLESRFDGGVSAGCGVIVIVNAAGGKTYRVFGLNLPTKSRERRPLSAFTPTEIAALKDWVEAGGSLLLVADHYPYGSSASALSAALGVQMGGGFTEAANVDSAHPHDRSRLVFSDGNGLLGGHPIIEGRSNNEKIHRVVTFTGQSLDSKTGTSLLLLGDSATDYVTSATGLVGTPTTGRSQATALELGRGRVVVMGEAAALTAQIDDRDRQFGMQLPGEDNQQFALNVMHWLTRIL